MKPVPAQRTPTVSVVVPCYNYGHFLPDAVHSVLSQPGVRVDVLIIDDCSTDGSDQVATRLADADTRVTTIVHEQNKGHIATYNEGLALVSGDYVVLLSADDLLAPGCLERATSLMEANPTVGLVYGYAAEFTDQPPRLTDSSPTWSVWSGREWIRRMARRGTNMIVNPEAVTRGDVMRHLVGYRSDMPHAADMELWLRVAAISDIGRINGPDQAYYRVHGANMHLDREAGLAIDDMTARAEVFSSFFDEHPDIVGRDPALPQRAKHAIALEAVRAVSAKPSSDPALRAHARIMLSYAQAICPAITGSWAWRRAEPGALRGMRLFAADVDAWIHRLRWSLRWQRWRRYGT